MTPGPAAQEPPPCKLVVTSLFPLLMNEITAVLLLRAGEGEARRFVESMRAMPGAQEVSGPFPFYTDSLN